MFDIFADEPKLITIDELISLEKKGYAESKYFVYKYNISFSGVDGILLEHRIKKEVYRLKNKESYSHSDVVVYDIETATNILEIVISSMVKISNFYYKSEYYSKKFQYKKFSNNGVNHE